MSSRSLHYSHFHRTDEFREIGQGSVFDFAGSFPITSPPMVYIFMKPMIFSLPAAEAPASLGLNAFCPSRECRVLEGGPPAPAGGAPPNNNGGFPSQYVYMIVQAINYLLYFLSNLPEGQGFWKKIRLSRIIHSVSH